MAPFLITLATAGSPLMAQEASNSDAGGAVTFAKSCAGCHGPEGIGGDHGPQLRGELFWAQWVGQPTRRLYSRIISTMPQDDPGSLSEQQTLGIVAYLTKINTGVSPTPPVSSADMLNSLMVAPAMSDATK